MNIPAEAIEAAAQALFNFLHCQENGEVLDWQTEVGEGYRDDYRRHVQPILEAAMPAIREQLAQEILDSNQDYKCDIPVDQKGHPMACIWEVATDAARIVEGKP